MERTGITPRPNLIQRLRAAFSPGPVFPAQRQSSRMPDLERWVMPHRTVDMKDWEVALNMAQNVFNPDRSRLMDLYESLLKDSHLASVMESRVLRVVRSKYKLVGKDGKPKVDLMPMLEQQWFEDFLQYVAEAVFRGHTLIELGQLAAPGQLKSVERIDPRNVHPWTGVVVKRQGETTGYKFREDPLKPYLIEVGRADDLGILERVAPVVVVKKYAIGSWSDFVEKFGIPARWVKTSTSDKKRHLQLQGMMRQMISSAYAVIQGDEEIQVMETPGTDAHKVFDELIRRMNSEISKRVLGQDGTSDNKDASGTYGSLKVLQGVAEDRHQADKASVMYVINNELLPRLVNLGYPFAGVRFAWDEMRDLTATEQVDAVSKLGPVFEFDPLLMAERTGLPIIGVKRAPGEVSDNAPPASGRQGGKKKGKTTSEEGDDDDEEDGVTASWPRAHAQLCNVCGGGRDIVAAAPIVGAEALEQLLRDIHAGAEWSQPYFEAVATPFVDGLLNTWRHDLEQLTYDAPDHVARTMMEANLFRFSAAKTLAITLDLNEHVRESTGFADFKRRVEESGKLNDYNRTWMEAEYVNAVNTGMQASRWFQMQNSADVLPYGEYITQGDLQVRPAHQALDGKKWPLSDPIWGTIWPPNGWKCRCTVLPTQEGPTGEALDAQSRDINGGLHASGELERMKKTGFASNKAITGEVFKLNNAYRDQLGDLAGKAVKLNVEESYGNDAAKATLDAINKRTLPVAGDGASTPDEALRLFRNNADGVMVMKDHTGKPWTMGRSTVEEHINGTKYVGQDRYKTLHLVPEILEKPDEVWLTSKGGTTQTYAYVRYYEGKPMVVRTTVDRSDEQPMRVSSWYTLTEGKEAQVRNGLLVKRMPG